LKEKKKKTLVHIKPNISYVLHYETMHKCNLKRLETHFVKTQMEILGVFV